MQTTNQTEFKIEKVIKRKDGKIYVKARGYDNSFNSWIDKKKMVTKFDKKGMTSIDTSKFAKKADLATLKSDVEKLDVGNLKTFLVDLSTLSDVVKYEVVKKTVYD